MARVVQRRSNPPYLLIIFVFLFLIAATVAILQYVEASKLSDQLEVTRQERQALATDSELQTGEIRSMMRDAEETGGSVVAQQNQRIQYLAEYISPNASNYEEAMAVVRDLEDEFQSSDLAGLAEKIEELRAEIDRAEDRIASLQGESQSWQEQAQIRNEKAEELKTTFQQTEQQVRREINRLQEEIEQRETQHSRQLARAEDDYGESRSMLEQDISQKNSTIGELKEDLYNKEQQLAKLRDQVAQWKRQRIPGADPNGADGSTVVANPGRQADGQIARVIDGTDVCYIDLGRQDRVRPGLTFAVYSPAGIPSSGEGKGKLVVTDVSSTISECRIVQQDNSNPVVAEDLIANIAFDPDQTHTFVVEGEFDLYGSSAGGRNGGAEVKELIRRFGGEVTQDVDIQTDFVVLGSPPTMPRKPDESASQQEHDLYLQAQEEYREYNTLRELAANLGIPVLNANRFLAFTGYQPQRSLKYSAATN